MSKIRVNNKITINGKFSVATKIDYSTKPHQIAIDGVFQSAEYIEEITKLESDRYIVVGIKVIQESFGSEDDDICYTFTAGGLKVKQKEGKSNG